MIKTAAEWNKESEEARMASVLTKVVTRAPEGEIFRRWKGSLFLTTEGRVVNVTEKQFQQRRFEAGTDVSEQYSFEERMEAVKDIFPLQSETLFKEVL